MYLRSAGRPWQISTPVMGRITKSTLAPEERCDHIYLLDSGTPPDVELAGYKAVLSPKEVVEFGELPGPGVYGVKRLEYLSTGDVVVLLPSGGVNVLYRRSSRHNTVLATERCNSFCLMCSQPPRTDDDSYRVAEILRLTELVDPLCEEIGISGGEPTLLGDGFLTIVGRFKENLPFTRLHVLTNGRKFSDAQFAQSLGNLAHPALMLGIPLYSDIDSKHDYVVQAQGAFRETTNGLHNLARHGVAIEIRVVLHAQTFERLPQLAEYLYWNFPFAAHVALMGLEMFGFVHHNLAELWIDPYEYRAQLEEATLMLAMRGMPVSIYNHQLCTIPQSLWPFARKSISDWKNVYLDECSHCGMREFCGGFFHSATKKHSARIQAISPAPDAVIEKLRSFAGAEVA